MAAKIRLAKELKEVAKKDVNAGVHAVQIGDSDRHLRGTIIGSEGTPYEGGEFDIDIEIPGQYPFEPPRMRFITKIWHPNISSQTGAICLVSLLRNGESGEKKEGEMENLKKKLKHQL